MQIEAVIVCDNYGDFLAQTLPENMHHFDRVVVVTSHNDRETIGLCHKYTVDVVKTNCMHDDGDAFNKGKAINLGLGHLKGTDWLLHLDADIVLPHNFRNLLKRAQLQKENLYGADRVNVVGYENWLKFKQLTIPYHSSGYFIEPPKGSALGARIIHHEHGYTPIGYFQFWHKSQGKRYPIHQGNAEHTDVLFAAQWARQHRVLLPDIFCYHLESECAPMGTNWNGRRTKRFGPCHEKPKPPYHPKKCREDEL